MTTTESAQMTGDSRKHYHKFPMVERFLDGWSIFAESLIGKIGLTLLVIFGLMALGSFWLRLMLRVMTTQMKNAADLILLAAVHQWKMPPRGRAGRPPP